MGIYIICFIVLFFVLCLHSYMIDLFLHVGKNLNKFFVGHNLICILATERKMGHSLYCPSISIDKSNTKTESFFIDLSFDRHIDMNLTHVKVDVALTTTNLGPNKTLEGYL